MTSHIEQQIAARIARVRAEQERKRQEREELAAARAAGVAKRHAQKLYRQAHAQSQTTEDEPMPAALRTAYCPSCRHDRNARLVARVIVTGAPYNALRCPEEACELLWLVRAERPRTAPVAA